MVKANRLDAPDASLQDGLSSQWRPLQEEVLALAPTPLSSQPSGYVQASWAESPYGTTPRVAVKAAHNGRSLFFRLAWADETEDAELADTDRFADAAAVLFPVQDDAPLLSMGSPQQPVNGWYWRPDLEEPLSVIATGLGTSARQAGAGIAATAAYADGGWTLVLSRPLGANRPGSALLALGAGTKVAFAVWQGSNRERGGLKAITQEWQPLEIEA